MEFNLSDVKDFGGVGLILVASYMLAVSAGKFCAPLIRDVAAAIVNNLSAMSEQARSQSEQSKLQTRILDGLLLAVSGIAEDQRIQSITLEEVREIIRGQKCCQSSSSIKSDG